MGSSPMNGEAVSGCRSSVAWRPRAIPPGPGPMSCTALMLPVCAYQADRRAACAQLAQPQPLPMQYCVRRSREERSNVSRHPQHWPCPVREKCSGHQCIIWSILDDICAMLCCAVVVVPESSRLLIGRACSVVSCSATRRFQGLVHRPQQVQRKQVDCLVIISMSSHPARLHLALVANEAYAVGLAATVQSVLESLLAFYRSAEIYILDFGLSEQSRRWLSRVLDIVPGHGQQEEQRSSSKPTCPKQIQMHMLSLTSRDHGILSQLPADVGYASAVTWAKLFLLDLLPTTAHNDDGLLLYLDSDVIVTPGTDIGHLWDEYHKKSPHLPHQPILAAVADLGQPGGHAKLRALGWPGGASSINLNTAPRYFNAGVLLLHMPTYRLRILPEIKQLLGIDNTTTTSNIDGGIGEIATLGGGIKTQGAPSGRGTVSRISTNDLLYADQDMLNLVCSKNWLELDYKWNVQGIGSYLMDRCRDHGPDRPQLFSEDQAAELELHPAIIHFTGTPNPKPSEILNPWVNVPAKPWAFVSTHPYKQLFYDFINKTHWQGITADQADLESAAVDELFELADRVEQYCTTGVLSSSGSDSKSAGVPQVNSSSSRFSRQQFLSSVGQKLTQAAAAEAAAATTSTASNSSKAVTDDNPQDELHPVFKAFKDPPNPNVTLAGIDLDPQAGFSFTDVWFDPHAPSWEKNVISNVIPQGPASKAVRVLEIGLWEGRSTCYILNKLAIHPDSKVVCVDPFDKLYPAFNRNRSAWLRNMAAAGGLGAAAADAVRAAAAAATAGIPDSLLKLLYRTATTGAGKVELMHEASGTALCKLLGRRQQQPGAASSRSTPTSSAGAASAAEQAATQQFDLIYIDGSHMRVDVLEDAVLAWPLLKTGGVMVFDDYEWDRYRDNMVCHPKEGIDAFLLVHGHQLQVIHKGYQVVLRKTQ